VIGSHEDLQAATVGDVQQFFDTFYVPVNASLVVAGDFDPAAIKPLIDRLFGTLPSRPIPAHAPEPKAVVLEGVKRLTVSDSVQLSRITMAWPTPALFAPGDADMDVLAGILGQGKSSRLWQRLVRDEKLCAEISAWQGSRKLDSVFEIEATCAPESDLARVEAVIDEEIGKLHEKGPSDEEIRRVRNQIDHAMLQRLESLQDRADQLNAYENARHEPDSLQWDLDRYAAISVASARRAAREHLPLDRRLVVTVLTQSPRATRPEPAAAGGFTFPQPESWTLDNGLTVHLWTRPQLPLVAARLSLPYGASSDPAIKSGETQLALDMLDEGTTRLGAPQFSDALEILGARMSIGARRETSAIGLRSTKATFPDALALMAEAITSPALDPAEWARVQDLHRQDVQQRDDDPASVAPVVASRRLFGEGHPFASPVDGDVATINAVTLDDVKALLPRILRPDRATLLLAGDLSRAEAEALVAERFGSWRVDSPAAPKPAAAARTARPFEVVLVHRPGAVQTVIRFAWAAPPYSDPDRVPLDLLNTILGGSFTSRLNQNLREAHGYTYGANSRFIMMPSLGIASAQSSVRADVTGASIGEFLKELDRIREGGISDDEVAKAQATVRNRRVDSTSGLDGLIDQAEEVLSAGLPFGEVDRALQSLTTVTAAQLDDLAKRRVIPREGVLVLVGDRDVVLPQLAGLGLPAPIEVDAEGRVPRR
jgi:zinc protease